MNNEKYNNKKIVIVDNNSFMHDDESKLSGLTIIKNHANYGYAGGNKRGIDFAIEQGAELIWILNPDCIVKDDGLTRLVEYYLTNKKVILGSLVYSTAGEINFGGSRIVGKGIFKDIRFNRKVKQYGKDGHAKKTEKVSVVNGMSFLIPTEIIKKYGFMDQKYFLYAEEHDYCLRLRENGIYSVIVPNSIVWHQMHGATKNQSGMNKILKYYKTRNRFILIKKHFGFYPLLKMIARLSMMACYDFFTKRGSERYVIFDAFFDAITEQMGISGKYNPDVYYKKEMDLNF